MRISGVVALVPVANRPTGTRRTSVVLLLILGPVELVVVA